MGFGRVIAILSWVSTAIVGAALPAAAEPEPISPLVGAAVTVVVCQFAGADHLLANALNGPSGGHYPGRSVVQDLMMEMSRGGTVGAPVEAVVGGVAMVGGLAVGIIFFALDTGLGAMEGGVSSGASEAAGAYFSAMDVIVPVKCLVSGVINSNWDAFVHPRIECWFWGGAGVGSGPGWLWLYDGTLPWPDRPWKPSASPPCV